jgi:hypothetical protein
MASKKPTGSARMPVGFLLTGKDEVYSSLPATWQKMHASAVNS